MAAVQQLAGHAERLGTLRRRRHGAVALAKAYDVSAVSLQLRGQLRGVPAVDGYATYLVLLGQVVDISPHAVVVRDVAFGHVQMALLVPHVIGHLVTAYAGVHVVRRNPEMRFHPVRAILEGEEQHQCRGVVGGCQVQPGPALTARKRHRAGHVALRPVIHPQPPLVLLCPLVQVQLPKRVFVGRHFDGTCTLGA